jgi:hypothetical protein
MGWRGWSTCPAQDPPRRLTEHERGRIIQLAGLAPSGRLQQGARTPGAHRPPGAGAIGSWALWPRPLRPRASGWAAARSVASCWPNGCAGGGPAHGRRARPPVRPQRTQVIACYTTPPPDVTVGSHHGARLGHPPQLPAHARLDRRRSLRQGAVGLRPRAGEDLGLRRAPRR